MNITSAIVNFTPVDEFNLFIYKMIVLAVMFVIILTMGVIYTYCFYCREGKKEKSLKKNLTDSQEFDFHFKPVCDDTNNYIPIDVLQKPQPQEHSEFNSISNSENDFDPTKYDKNPFTKLPFKKGGLSRY